MELYHHGVKGQRWGVRRYQNKDGTLNAAGLKRLQKLENKKENLQKMLNENHSRVSSTREKYADASEKYRQAKGLGKLKAGWNKLVAYDKYMGARERRGEEGAEIHECGNGCAYTIQQSRIQTISRQILERLS